MDSHRAGCCSARCWTLFIGWFQTISCALFFLAYVALLVVFSLATHEVDSYNDAENTTTVVVNGTATAEEEERNMKIQRAEIVVSMGVIVLANVVGFIAGIYLILGVIQKNARKLKLWIIVEGAFVVCGLAAIIYGLVQGDYSGVIFEIVLILLSVFSIWVVNVHRQEVLLNSMNANVREIVGFLNKV